jgi:hypothetical protein
MVSSGMLRGVALVRTDVSEKLSGSFIRVTRIGELGTTLAVTSVRRLLVTSSVVPSSPIVVTLMKEALSSSEMSVLTRAKRSNIPEDTILHRARCGLRLPHAHSARSSCPLPVPQVQSSFRTASVYNTRINYPYRITVYVTFCPST